MLSDPLMLGIADSATTQAFQTDLSTQPYGNVIGAHLVPQTGASSVRFVTVGDSVYKVTISHSESNENKPFVTSRSVIRLDRVKVNGTTGTEVTLSAYMVVALPIGPDFDVAAAVELTSSLSLFLAFGQANEGQQVSAVYDDTLTRIIGNKEG